MQRDEEFDRATLLLDSSGKSRLTKITQDTNHTGGNGSSGPTTVKGKGANQNPYYYSINNSGGGSSTTAQIKKKDDEEEILDFANPSNNVKKEAKHRKSLFAPGLKGIYDTSINGEG